MAVSAGTVMVVAAVAMPGPPVIVIVGVGMFAGRAAGGRTLFRSARALPGAGSGAGRGRVFVLHA